MAIPGPLTMLDIASQQMPSLKKAVIMAMFKGTLPSPMDALPVESAQSLSQQTIRTTDVGTPTTRDIGATVTAYQAQFTTGTETLKVIENKISIDKVLLAQKNFIQDPIAIQLKTYGEAVKLLVNDLLINGNPATTTSDPAGIQYRLANDSLFLNQCVNGAALNVDANDTTRYQWLDLIDQAIDNARGRPQIMVVNRQTRLAFRSALRALKLFATTKDSFDRDVMVYGDTRIYDAGMKPAGALTGATANQVIPNDTTTDLFGNTNSTPIYFICTAGEDDARLLQLYPLKTDKIGIDTSNPGSFLVDVNWPIGFFFPQKFCLSSVQGLDIS